LVTKLVTNSVCDISAESVPTNMNS